MDTFDIIGVTFLPLLSRTLLVSMMKRKVP